MKYMLLIHHGSTQVRGSEAWDALPHAEIVHDDAERRLLERRLAELEPAA